MLYKNIDCRIIGPQFSKSIYVIKTKLKKRLLSKATKLLCLSSGYQEAGWYIPAWHFNIQKGHTDISCQKETRCIRIYHHMKSSSTVSLILRLQCWSGPLISLYYLTLDLYGKQLSKGENYIFFIKKRW